MRVSWSPAARQHFAEARAFIVAENPAAARAFASRIRRSVARIGEFPQAGELLSQADLRATTVPGTPYRLVYTQRSPIVLIIALWHGACEWPFD